MIEVSNASRVVFPALGRTKGDVVAHYERVAARALPHLAGRPLSIRRFPKGLSGPGFFQKNVPPHYPSSIGRFEVPRSKAASKKHPKGKDRGFTVYPVVHEEAHLPYLANQGMIELHVPTGRVPEPWLADRFILDLDPPEDGLAKVRRAAHLVRDALGELGLATVPVATGSRGYHVVAAITPSDGDALALTAQKLGALLAERHPDLLTIEFRIKNRGERVFVDWLRNRPLATVVAPYSLRARPRATVATPLAWDEVDDVAPGGFTIDDADALLDRADTLAALARSPAEPAPFVAAVDEAFDATDIDLTPFDRFRS